MGFQGREPNEEKKREREREREKGKREGEREERERGQAITTDSYVWQNIAASKIVASGEPNDRTHTLVTNPYLGLPREVGQR